MAKVNHTGAFAPAQPLQGNVSDWTVQQEQMNARQRAEIQGLEDRKNAEREKRRQKYKDIIDEYKDIYLPDATGVRSLDEVLSKYGYSLIEEQGKLAKIKADAWEKGDSVGYQEAERKKKLLDNTGKFLRGMMDTEKATAQLFADGKKYATAENKKRMQSIVDGRFDLFLDKETYKPMLKFHFDYNDDGKIDENDIISLEEIMQGGIFGEIYDNFDMNASAGAISKNLKAPVNDNKKGTIIETTTGFNDDFYNQYSLTPQQLFVEADRRGLNPNDTTVISELNNEYREAIKAGVNSGKKIKDNTPYSTYASGANKPSSPPHIAYDRTENGTGYFSLSKPYVFESVRGSDIPGIINAIEIKGNQIILRGKRLKQKVSEREQKAGETQEQMEARLSGEGVEQPNLSTYSSADYEDYNPSTANEKERAEVISILSNVTGLSDFNSILKYFNDRAGGTKSEQSNNTNKKTITW